MKNSLSIKHNNKIFLVMLAFLVIVFIGAARSADVPSMDENGYYLIKNTENLIWFRDKVNSGESSIKAKLLNDIYYDYRTEGRWNPIGNGSDPSRGLRFSGEFDGQGYEIHGIGDCRGFFGSMYNATIKNLTISGSFGTCIVKPNYDEYYVGGLCARAYYSKIINCINKIPVNGSGDVSGICGEILNVEIINCVNLGTVTQTDPQSTRTYSDMVGGICGYARGKVNISNCVNEGRITGKVFDTGGICGFMKANGYNAEIMNCVNTGNISTSAGYSAGGICGRADAGTSKITISNCGALKATAVGTKSKNVNVVNCNIYNKTSEIPAATAIMLKIDKLRAGDKYKPSFDIYPTNAYNKEDIYTQNNSSNPAVVFAEKDRLIGVSAGQATITSWVYGVLGAIYKPLLANFENVISVSGSAYYPITAIELNKNKLTLTQEYPAEKLKASVVPEEYYYVTDYYVKWESGNTAVAIVDAKGNVSAVGEGQTTIFAKSVNGTVSPAVCNVIVNGSFSIANYSLCADKAGTIAGGSFTVKMKVLFKDLQKMAVTGIQSVVNYATDILELVSAEKSDISGAIVPVISAGKVDFSLENKSGVEFDDNVYYDFGTMTFRVKQGATVGTKSNITITDATYRLTDGIEKYATTTDTTIEVYQSVTGINISSSTGSTTVLAGNTLQLNAAVSPNTAKTKDIQWISNDEGVATVDANGLVTAQMISGKTANVTITAKALDGSNVTGNITLTVKRPKVTGMNFAQAAYELESDSVTKNLYSELSVTPNTALKPAANEITWQSSNTNFTIDTNGIISLATATGEQQSTTVTAKYTNEDSQLVTATCTVSSKPPKVTLNLATKLEGRQSGGGTGTNVEKIEVWLYNSANKPLWNGTGTTDTNGNVSFEIDSSILTAGQSVKVWIKGERYLAKLLTQTVTLSGSNWNVTMPSALKAADTNADNRVASADFLVLRKSYMYREGSAQYDRLADFDANGRIASPDFLMLRKNYMVRGDAKPQAAVTMLMTAAARNGTTEAAMEVLNTETAKVAEEALENSTATDEEQQEEEILAAVQAATNAPLKAASAPATSSDSSTNSNESSSSSGGCNAGYGALALLFAIPLIFKKRK